MQTNNQVKPGMNGKQKTKVSLIREILKLPEEERPERIAVIVAGDPITTAEVAEILSVEPQAVYRIPFEKLPHLKLNEKRRLYSRRLVVEFMANQHRRLLHLPKRKGEV